MEKDKIFFGDNGLTETSANFNANLAKERYATDLATLDNIAFTNRYVRLISQPNNEFSIISEGVKTVSDVKSTLDNIAKLKSLIAWFREAIKAKERLLKEARDGSYEYYGIDVPNAPVREAAITEDDCIANMNIKQRNRYYYLEAYCATIGEFIHPGGHYSDERNSLNEAVQKPSTVSGSGRDALIYTQMPSLPVQEVEDTYMELQQTYRSYQAELNQIKYDIQNTVIKDQNEKNIKYNNECAAYRNEMRVIDAELAKRKHATIDNISKLKIVIPDSLRETFDMVQNLGKKK